MAKVLVIADSRGRFLHAPLSQQQAIGSLKIMVLPGATIELSVLKSVAAIGKFRPQTVIIMTGICDITQRNRATKLTTLRHTNVYEVLTRFKSAASDAYALILSLHPNIKIILAPITGVDLLDYNNKHRQGLSEAEYKLYKANHGSDPNQDLLNSMVLSINKWIVSANVAHKLPTPWIATDVHRYHKGMTHHQYWRLKDGCHPSQALTNSWAKKLARACRDLHQQPNNSILEG